MSDEASALDLLVEIFGWPTDDKLWRYQAHIILRKARGQVPITWDDFKADVYR